MHHHVQKLVKDRQSRIKWILSLSILADNVTKALLARLFKKYQDQWELRD